MRAPAVAVLLGQVAAKCFRKLGPDRVQIVRNDPKSDPSPQVHQPGNHCARWWKFGGERGEPLAKLVLEHRGNRVEYREMRREPVALGRKMRARSLSNVA